MTDSTSPNAATTGTTTTAAGGGQSLLARFRTYGRNVVIMEEMVRLGFWPPDADAEEKRDQALAEIRAYQAELLDLRRELRRVEGEIEAATDVEALIAEIRKRRIERVRAEREQRRADKARRQEERRATDQQRRRERPPFLGHGVSGGLRYEGGDVDRLAALGLPQLGTASDVAAAIGIDEGGLAWLTYHRGAATVDHYHRFTIPKRNGGRRVISSPKTRLRVAQGWLLRAVLSRLALHDAAMAFRPARSIADNARLHQGRAVVVRIDLKDFFPSIGFRRVKGLFESFGYNEGISTIMALLSTEAPRATVTLDGERRYVAIGGRQLPQGACTSPAVTNILCRGMDARLTALSARFGFTYSRYADDLVFSHAQRGVAMGLFLSIVKGVVTSEGFTVNDDKTRVMRPHQRQTVNGLVVNAMATLPTSVSHAQPSADSYVHDVAGSSGGMDTALISGEREDEGSAIRLSRVDLRRFRAVLHHCETEGFDAVSARLGKNAHVYAAGYLAYIHMVSPHKAAQLVQRHPWLSPRHADAS